MIYIINCLPFTLNSTSDHYDTHPYKTNYREALVLHFWDSLTCNIQCKQRISLLMPVTYQYFSCLVMPFDVYFIDKCNEITAIHPTYGSANVQELVLMVMKVIYHSGSKKNQSIIGLLTNTFEIVYYFSIFIFHPIQRNNQRWPKTNFEISL